MRVATSHLPPALLAAAGIAAILLGAEAVGGAPPQPSSSQGVQAAIASQVSWGSAAGCSQNIQTNDFGQLTPASGAATLSPFGALPEAQASTDAHGSKVWVGCVTTNGPLVSVVAQGIQDMAGAGHDVLPLSDVTIGVSNQPGGKPSVECPIAANQPQAGTCTLPDDGSTVRSLVGESPAGTTEVDWQYQLDLPSNQPPGSYSGGEVIFTATGSAPSAEPTNTVPPELAEQTPHQDLADSVSTGTWSGSPTSYSYQWQRCDASGSSCADISAATSSSYTPTAQDVGHTLRVQVHASNGAGSGTASSATSDPVRPAPPLNSEPPSVSPSTPQEGAAESTSNGIWSNSPTSFSYQWQDCDGSGQGCTDISGASASSYTPQASDVGHTLVAVVSAENAGGSTTQASTPTAQVNPAAPTSGGSAPEISGTPIEGNTLNATHGTFGGGAVSSYDYQWLRCDSVGEKCVSIAGADEGLYILSSADVGHTIEVQVHATNISGSATETSQPTGTVLGPPINTAPPLITPSVPRQGQPESVSNGSWSNGPTSYAYQWQECDASGSNCADIAGANSASYTPTTADIGHTLRAEVTASNAAGETLSTSSASGEVLPAVPVNTVSPVISSENPTVGSAETTSTGTWSHSPSSYTYQWLDCNASGGGCSAISGATSSSYTPVAADAGHALVVEVTASNAGGSGAPSSSSPTNQVTESPSNSVLPALSTIEPTSGVALSTSSGTWLGFPAPTFSYQWQQCNAFGGECANISGASSSSYTPSAADVGETLQAVVKASNSAGNASATTLVSNIVSGAPVNTVAPSLSSSTAVEGTSLSVSNGTWGGYPSPTYTYQWLQCNSAGESCTNITGATNPNYTPTENDVGSTVRAQVTATNFVGFASATTSASSVVIPPVPVNTALPVVSPSTAQQGVAESTTNGSWTHSPSSFSYQWLQCDSSGESCSNISGATNSSYTPAEADVGQTLRVEVTASNAGGSSSATSAVTAVVVPPAPVNSVLPAISPSTPQQGIAESTSNGTWSNSPTSFSYQWEDCDSSGENCSNISAATSSSYTPVAADVGHTLRVEVSASNAGGSASATSGATAIVVPPAPVNTTLPSLSNETPQQGVAESTTNGTWSNSPSSFSYQWLQCNSSGESCSNISAATASTYTPAASDVGSTLRVKVSASNAGGSASATSAASNVVVPPTPVNTTLPSLSNETPQQGVAESTTNGTWSNSPSSFSYQWLQCNSSGESCSNISGATSSSYSPVAADVGHTLRVKVSASNAGGSASATSAASNLVVPPAPVNTVLPVISPSAPQQGVAASTTNGTWSNSPTGFSYQWEDCNSAGESCANISGATASSYTPTASDVGSTLRVKVSASNAGGTANATSGATAIVVPPAPVNTALPSLSSQTPQQGVTETVANGTWSNSPTSYSYQWQRCNASGGECSAISGATSSSYTPTGADVGHALRALVTASNAGGQNSATSPASGEVLPAVPVNTVPPVISSENPTVGIAETASTGTWSNSPTSFNYQWQQCNASGGGCSAIPGATSSSYTPVAADAGHAVVVDVTASNAGGGGVFAASAPTNPVTQSPSNSVLPALSTINPTEGVALSTTTGSWIGYPTPTFSYQWQQCNAFGGECANISGASSSSYTPSAADVGETLQAVVKASNSAGNASATTLVSNIVSGAPVNTVAPSLSSSTAVEGTSLSVSNGTWGGYPSPTYTYQWLQCNSAGESCTNITGATNPNYTPVEGDVTHKLRARVTATNSVGTSSATTTASNAVLPQPPVNTVLPVVSPSTPQQGVAESTTNGTWTHSPSSFSYQWLQCNSAGESCSNISGATNSSYTPVEADVGHTLRAKVSASNAGGSGSATSAASNAVVPPAPVNTVLPVVSPSTPQQGVLESTTNGTWSNSPTSFSYQWLQCNSAGESCSNISGATNSSYTPVAGDVGHTLRAKVTATNSGGSTTATSAASASVLPAAPVNTVLPVISPSTPQQGVAESTTNGTWSNSPTSFTYQWQQCNSSGESCTNISGATNSSYTPVEGDVGHTLRVKVTATNSGGNTTATSGASASVLPAAPVNSVLPVISPSAAQQGVAESTTNGTWSNSPTSFSYQWQQCNSAGESCSNISGATNSSYTPVEGDVGHTLRVKVTATNSGGSTAATSAASASVLPAAPVNTVLPVVSPSTPQQGVLESTTNGTWSNSPTSFSYQWLQCNSSGESCSNISAATSSTYTPVAGDVGHTLRVKVTASNAGGSTSATSAATPTVLPTAPANTVLPALSSTLPQQGSPIATTNGTWTNSPTSFSYQWQRCNSAGESCSNISGATSSSYTPSESDLEHTLIAKVTATNAGGSATAATAHSPIVLSPAGTTNEYSVPSGSTPLGITTGSDNNLWFADSGSDAVSKMTTAGVITEFKLSSPFSCPNIIASGSDNNLWFTDNCDHQIGKITTAGVPTAFNLTTGSGLQGIAAGPDGNLWFAAEGTSKIGKITTAGTITEFALPGSSFPEGVTTGPDGNVWFTDAGTSKVGKITTGGTITEFALPAGSTPYGIITGSDGNLWFTNYSSSKIAKITTGGSITEFALPANSFPRSIVSGPDGNLWFVDEKTAKVGKITTAGTITEYALPSGSSPKIITVGPDRNLWFTEASAIGKIAPSAVAGVPINTVLPALSTSSPEVGVSVTAGNGTWSNSPTSFSYQWQDCNSSGQNCTTIAGASSSTYTPVAGDSGKRLRVVVVATNASGSAAAASSPTNAVVLPAVPVNSTAPTLSPESPVRGASVSVSNGSWSSNPTSFSYQWQRCNSAGESCSNISGATSSTYTPGASDVTNTLKAQVTATNAGGSSSPASTTASAAVREVPVVSANPVLSTEAPEQNVQMSVSNGTWTGFPASFTYTYQWLRCNSAGQSCQTISGATNSTYIPVAGDIGNTLEAQVIATNTAGSGAPASSAVTQVVIAAPPPPSNTVLPALSTNSPQQAVAISTTTGTWSNSPTFYSYQWQRCNASGESCSSISGATSSSYTPVEADVGSTLRAAVTAENPGGSGSATSAATSVVVPPAPVNSALPVISPSSPKQGTAESTTTGTWSNSPTSFSYQWEDCNSAGESCSNISAATSSTYTPVEGDVGHTLRVQVNASNAGGSGSATSAATATVVPPAPVNTALPVISPSSPQQGSLELASNGTWTNSPTSFTRQWRSCNSLGESCSNISGATGSTYTPVASDVGHTLRVQVTATNAGGSGVATSAATGVVAGSSHSQTIDSGNSINAVTCIPTTTDCVVSDSLGKALYATNVTTTANATWNSWAGPAASASAAIACPTTSLCLIADGGSVYYATSLGGAWTLAFSPSFGVVAISCPSSSFCVDGQGENGGFIRYSTSPGSTAWTAEGIGGSASINGVFCLSSSFCAAVDSVGNLHIATSTGQIESNTWTNTDIDGSTALNGVACTSTTSCVAVDGAGNLVNLTINGSGVATAVKHNIDSTNNLTAITCTTGSACVTVDSKGNIFISANAGETWVKQSALATNLTSVACSTASLCMAANTTGGVTTFEG